MVDRRQYCGKIPPVQIAIKKKNRAGEDLQPGPFDLVLMAVS
jgi:hypothetical protein